MKAGSQVKPNQAQAKPNQANIKPNPKESQPNPSRAEPRQPKFSPARRETASSAGPPVLSHQGSERTWEGGALSGWPCSGAPIRCGPMGGPYRVGAL